MPPVTSWSIPGADDQPILGNTQMPPGEPDGVILIAHGFKGYKDYGMFPRLACECAAAGFIAHRFNFSHSGMTNEIETFTRADLFERDTLNKQVADFRAVIEAAATGTLNGTGLPYVMFGHSRGGVTALLTAGRYAGDRTIPQPLGLITVSAPASCNPFSAQEAQQLLKQGVLESPSARTGQKLRIGKTFLQEQIDDPDAHNLLAMVRRIRCPLLVIHGERDPTVPVSCATAIHRAASTKAEIKIVPGANHVFNTPNPMSQDAKMSPQLVELVTAMIEFAQQRCT